MEKLCARVRAEDTAALEALVKPVRDRASAAAQDFLLLHFREVSQLPPPAAQSSSCESGMRHYDSDDEGLVSGRQIQLSLPEIPADHSAAESWDNLEEVCLSEYPNILFLKELLLFNAFFIVFTDPIFMILRCMSYCVHFVEHAQIKS